MTGTERDASSAVGADVADASAPTERERALMQRVAELEAIVESSPDVIACFDRSLRHVYVNRAVEAASGMPRDAFLGKDHDELGLPRELTEAWQAVYRHVFETGEEGTKAFEFEGANGVRSFVSRVVPMREADGTVSRVLSVARDVTDQRRAEQERLEIERKLSQANKLESLGILAGGIAHDFNNLLTGIIAGASLLRYRQADASVVAHAARQIERSGVRAAELCRQMLAYAGRAQSIERVSDLRAMASETVNLLSASLPAGVHVTLEHAGGPVAVRGDATQLRQVLMNLVLNAAEAIGARGGEVRVRTSEVDAKDVALERAIVAPASSIRSSRRSSKGADSGSPRRSARCVVTGACCRCRATSIAVRASCCTFLPRPRAPTTTPRASRRTRPRPSRVVCSSSTTTPRSAKPPC